MAHGARVGGSSLSALVAAAALTLALAAPAARAAPVAEDCVKLTARYLQGIDRSVISLQEQVQVHRATATTVDAFGEKLGLGPAWKAGNGHWAEAYRLFRPDLLAGMKVGAERERRHIETRLPPVLDAAMCRKAIAFLDSRSGSLAARIEDGVSGSAFLSSFEKAFPVPPSLRAQADAARKQLAEAVAPKDDPAVQRAEPQLAAARAEWRGYGKQMAEGLKRIGDPDPAAARKENQEAGARMMAKNREAFADIVRRFRAGA